MAGVQGIAVRVPAPTIYLAGPSIFFPDSRARAERMHAACRARGAIGKYPADEDIPRDGDPFAVAMAIFERDRELVEQSDATVADFTPYRGISADPGTVWEAAYGMGLGKPVAAFSIAAEFYPQRERAMFDDGHVSTFPTADNLMLTGANVWANAAHAASLERSGGLCVSFEAALDLVLETLRERARR